MKLRVFTDGACSNNPGPGGYAVVLTNDVSMEYFADSNINTTNNEMELTAVTRGLTEALKHEQYTNIEIHSDSAYVVNAINKKWLKKWSGNGWKKTKGGYIKNKFLWSELLSLIKECKSRHIKVSFVKVKAHSGNAHNEFVDNLAKEQAQLAIEKVKKGV